jgi:mono/diheme cytochrome c family protein
MRRTCFLLCLLLLAGCNESMDQQNRLKTYGEAKLPGWPGEGEALPLPSGTVPQEAQAQDNALARPPQVTMALLERGRQRYDIYCSACHGLTGAGDGMVVARGFPRPHDFSDPDQMREDARHLVDVIGQGYGRMYSFSDRVDPADRWAIIAYIRALQLAGTPSRRPG